MTLAAFTLGGASGDGDDEEEKRRKLAEGGGGGGDGDYAPQTLGGGGGGGGQAQARSAVAQAAQPQTFAQMQAAGVARPAPPAPALPTVGPSSRFTPTNATSPQRAQIQQQLAAMFQSPTSYGTPELERSLTNASRSIDDDYDLREKSLDDEMANRGLFESTEAKGRMSDLNIGRRSAKTSLADSLLEKQATMRDEGLRQALAMAIGLDSNLSQEELAAFEANAVGERFDTSTGLQRAGMERGAFESDRDAATGDYRFEREQGAEEEQFGKELGFKEKDLGARERMSYADIAARANEASADRDLRRELSTKEMGQADLDRQLRQVLGLGDLDIRKQSLAQQQADREEGKRRWETEFNAGREDRTWEQSQAEYENKASRDRDAYQRTEDERNRAERSDNTAYDRADRDRNFERGGDEYIMKLLQQWMDQMFPGGYPGGSGSSSGTSGGGTSYPQTGGGGRPYPGDEQYYTD